MMNQCGLDGVHINACHGYGLARLQSFCVTTIQTVPTYHPEASPSWEAACPFLAGPPSMWCVCTPGP